MTVYFGNAGRIELTRSSGAQLIEAVVNESDVTPALNGFSFNDLNDSSALVTGDLVEIKATDGRLLEWLAPAAWDDNQQHRDIRAYVSINQAGMLRLYREFEEAINEVVTARLPMVAFSGAPIQIVVSVENLVSRCIGQVTQFEFNSERNAVDVSQVGEEFRQVYSTAISGNGSLTAFFEYSAGLCEEAGTELPVYLHQLVVRQQLGAAFKAKLYVITRGSGKEQAHEIWYEFDAVITNCGLTVAPGEPMRSTINFLATGPINLRARFTSNYLTQENDDRILQERLQGDGALEVEQRD